MQFLYKFCLGSCQSVWVGSARGKSINKDQQIEQQPGENSTCRDKSVQCVHVQAPTVVPCNGAAYYRKTKKERHIGPLTSAARVISERIEMTHNDLNDVYFIHSHSSCTIVFVFVLPARLLIRE